MNTSPLVAPILTVREVKERLRCCLSQVYDLYHHRELLGFRVGAAIRIYEASVVDFINKNSNLPKTKNAPAIKPGRTTGGQGKRQSHSEPIQPFPLLGV